MINTTSYLFVGLWSGSITYVCKAKRTHTYIIQKHFVLDYSKKLLRVDIREKTTVLAGAQQQSNDANMGINFCEKAKRLSFILLGKCVNFILSYCLLK